MGSVADSVLFYGGISLAALALAGLVSCFLLFRLRARRLSRQLDEEYGPSLR